MTIDLQQLKTEGLLAIKAAKDKLELANLEIKLLGRKNGELTNILKSLKDLAAEVKKEIGPLANEVKIILESAVAARHRELSASAWENAAAGERLDITEPALPHLDPGHLHPITQVGRDLEDFFAKLGFMVLDGPELESDYYNFSALNFAADHPARDIMDTFYIKGHDPAAPAGAGWLMRTHTSPMQVRALQKYGAPLAAIVPGKCFRNESTDARHEHTLYQIEGFMYDTDITFAHLKGILEAVAKHLYGPEVKMRFSPKFYPFVEPGVRGEVTCFLCKGRGCRVCKNSGWLEIFGAGMTHPNVLKAGGVDPAKYQGFAFGLGLSRLVMLKYGIEDVRLLESGNIKFLEQF
ncbi:MAG: phenylalanine--tRNA ligase subunit alpha [Candidatus Magasanikbacteria bacterium]|nr:phenylalanine--tRNA ligase subunit alpha [Candidatus Magasanikbacteria bacterium]